MNYSIKWHPQASNFLDELQKDIIERILKKLDKVKENPFRYIEHYEGKYYKIRIGDFRLLLDIDFKNKILFVEVLDKRSRIYKR